MKCLDKECPRSAEEGKNYCATHQPGLTDFGVAKLFDASRPVDLDEIEKLIKKLDR